MAKAPFGRAGLGATAVASALALFVLAGGLKDCAGKRRRFDEKMGGGRTRPDAELPGGKKPGEPPGDETGSPEKRRDPPPDEAKDPPPAGEKKPPPAEPQTKLDEGPSQGSGGRGGDGAHPPPIPWDAGGLEAESGLRLRAASGPGRSLLTEDAVARLKAMLGDGADPAFFESGAPAVRYVEAGRYDGKPRRPDGFAPKPESGGYMLLGVRGKMRYLLLLPDGPPTMRVLKLGADGTYEIER